ncbi:FAD/NAD(P)-binding domain-containing protein [Lojkania enalia]|uniref:FAD/NAD(P)-binding domain-containing protein n=1 Tax=Lojkania enalia TaxID=147567 RepID=A0A9P4N4P0_9PLEO|nr:FAD/NAD(P)-binding domain-containing protein [Didymosphaeria enalia]
MADATVYDVLIIGGGPAGSSAALTLVRQRHPVLVFDTGKYRCDPSYYLHGLSGSDHKTPRELIATARKELEQYECFNSKTAEIVELKKVDGIFEAKDKDGTAYRGRKVILANGVSSMFPQIEGYESCWGKGIFHNLFAQAYNTDPKSDHAGVLAVDWIAMPQFSLHLSHLANQLAGSITIYTNGNDELPKQIADKIEGKPWKTDTRKIARIAMKSPQSSTAVDITFEDGETVTEAFLGHSPIPRLNGPFAEQLGLQLTPSGEYVTNGFFGETSEKGVYAAGDVMTMFKVLPNAVASGAQAAAGIAVALQEEKHGLPSVFG